MLNPFEPPGSPNAGAVAETVRVGLVFGAVLGGAAPYVSLFFAYRFAVPMYVPAIGALLGGLVGGVALGLADSWRPRVLFWLASAITTFQCGPMLSLALFSLCDDFRRGMGVSSSAQWIAATLAYSAVTLFLAGVGGLAGWGSSNFVVARFRGFT